MTPEEKAKELVEKFLKAIDYNGYRDFTDLQASKQCAIICVDETLSSTPYSPYDGSYYELPQDRIDAAIEYWIQVKVEITKL